MVSQSRLCLWVDGNVWDDGSSSSSSSSIDCSTQASRPSSENTLYSCFSITKANLSSQAGRIQASNQSNCSYVKVRRTPPRYLESHTQKVSSAYTLNTQASKMKHPFTLSSWHCRRGVYSQMGSRDSLFWRGSSSSADHKPLEGLLSPNQMK